jgi:hypothetical protein
LIAEFRGGARPVAVIPKGIAPLDYTRDEGPGSPRQYLDFEEPCEPIRMAKMTLAYFRLSAHNAETE